MKTIRPKATFSTFRHRSKFSVPEDHSRLAVLFLLTILVITACQYTPHTVSSLEEDEVYLTDSLHCLYEHHYTWGTNLVLQADSIELALLPVKDSYCRLYRGDRVVVAELDVHPQDSIDTLWVKLAHTQDIQGWVRECDMKESFVPADSISMIIHWFSQQHVRYFLTGIALCGLVWLMSAIRKKRLRLGSFNGIDSLYPLLLCLLTAICATLYECIQVYAPGLWEYFYYNPTLSPMRVPFVLGIFIAGLWCMLVVTLAVIDVVFRRLPFFSALSYLLGLASCCVFCYLFFMLTTRVYIGLVLLAAFVIVFIQEALASIRTKRYRCGQCGQILSDKGHCPRCGAMNE